MRFQSKPLPLAVAAALLLPLYAQADEAAAEPPHEQTLADIQVRGVAKQTGINYTVPYSSAATGLPLTQRETPQSLTVMTEKQIEDQNLDTLQDVLKQTAGVYHSKMGNNAMGHSQFISRGMAIDSISTDGVPRFQYEGKSIRRATNNLDSALYEQVAVVRGASGLANGGMGEPGGTVSLVRKRAGAQPKVSVEADVGSWKHFRLALDAGGPLNADKTLRGRAVIVTDHGGDYLPRARRRNQTVYGILSYDIAPQTTFDAGAEIHINRSKGSSRFGYLTFTGDEDDPSEGYRPFDASPRNNSSATWAYGKEKQVELFANLHHTFGNGWKLSGNYTFDAGHLEQLSGIAGTYKINHDFSSEVNADFDKSKQREHDFSVVLDGSYQLFGREHEFNAGTSFNDSKDTLSFYREAAIPLADIRTFDGRVERPDLPYIRDGFAKIRNLSVYGSTRIKATDRLAFILGGRGVHWTYKYSTDRNNFGYGNRKQKVFIPYFGTTYDLTDNLTAYASFTRIFRPQVRYETLDGNPIAPQRGETYEAGLKGAWYEGRLNGALAGFYNRRKNLGIRAGRRPNGESYYRAADKTDTKGFEISLNGRLTDRWLINASYAYSRTENSKGRRINLHYPAHLFKLFSSYDINDRLTLGGSLNWQSNIVDVRDEVTEPAAIAALTQRAYATVDLMAQYKISANTRIGLHAENITNKYYKTMPDIHVYGTPRSFTLSLKHTF